ncbi:hypothetical protein ACFP9V_07430 [Deinococcus radiopugnans]|uniref:TapB family protein n=1 Tax=Deinococcus radiopugnans TaxID=57497 RepID=UPI001115E720
MGVKACGLLLWSGGVAGAAPAACDNPMSPVQAGWVWTYRVSSSDGKKPASSYALSRAATGTGFQEQSTSAGKPLETARYTCVGGAQLGLQPPRLGSITLTRAAVSGTQVAAAPAWKAGAAWSLVWELEGRQGLLSGKATLTAKRQVLGREKVSVPAGTFDAWKVRVGYRVVGRVGPIPLNRDMNDFEEWYAEGVGLVKSQSSYSTTELLALQK